MRNFASLEDDLPLLELDLLDRIGECKLLLVGQTLEKANFLNNLLISRVLRSFELLQNGLIDHGLHHKKAVALTAAPD